MKADLNRKVLNFLRKIPKGRVTTYKELAHASGTGPRAVGRIMACNKEPEKYPCYKVVHVSGEVGNYSALGGRKKKMLLLKKDGVKITDGKVDKKYFWAFERGV